MEWSPRNFDRKFRGPTTLRRALENSINVVTVKLLQQVGVEPVVRLAHQVGIESDLCREIALALGVSEVTPLELVSPYGVYRLAYDDRIIPGVTAYGLPLTGMSPEQAVSALDDKFTYDDQTVFTFRDGEQFWQVSAGELGVRLDSQATAAQALAMGHSGNLFADVIDQGLTWLNGASVTPVIRYDQVPPPRS